MLNKLERKFGKYAVPNLMNYIVGAYILGYLILAFSTADRSIGFLSNLTLEPYMIIHRLQIWRIVTWLIIPPSSIGLFTAIMIFFYWQLGRSLEAAWGTFRFNLYMFGGMFFTILGAFIYYLVFFLVTGMEPAGIGWSFSTYYINMSIFLAFSTMIPDMRVLLYFFIPVKIKWLAILYAIMIGVNFYDANPPGKVAIASSLLNFLIFYYVSKKGTRFRRSSSQSPFGAFYSRRTTGTNTDRQTQQTTNAYTSSSRNFQVSRHKCAICGRTELTNPELEFRFCSKCNGNYEYCSDHLFSHNHQQ